MGQICNLLYFKLNILCLLFSLFYYINLLVSLLLLMIFFLLKHTEPTSGGSMRKRATIMPSCSSMRRKAMISWAQADMKRGFFVQIFFLLPARIRAMRFVWGQIPNIIRTYSTYWICCNLRSPFLQSTHCYYAVISMKNPLTAHFSQLVDPPFHSGLTLVTSAE